MLGKKKLNPGATSKLAEVKLPGDKPAEEVAVEVGQAPIDEHTPAAEPAQNPKAKPQATGIIRRAKKSAQPTSFRLTEDDKATLQQIVDRVNDESSRKISRDKVIQALIHAGDKMPTERILKALREIY